MSNEVAILAAQRPDTPTIPITTSYLNETVTFTWTLPSDGGSPITAYRIYIREQDETSFT
jgi:hypothetical protein